MTSPTTEDACAISNWPGPSFLRVALGMTEGRVERPTTNLMFAALSQCCRRQSRAPSTCAESPSRLQRCGKRSGSGLIRKGRLDKGHASFSTGRHLEAVIDAFPNHRLPQSKCMSYRGDGTMLNLRSRHNSLNGLFRLLPRQARMRA